MTSAGSAGWRPGSGAATGPGTGDGGGGATIQGAGRGAGPSHGVRVVMDLRPLQDPDRGPLTAVYLEQLLTALAADPLDGESFTFLLAADQHDPTDRWPGLDVAQRRLLPPTRLLRSGALTVDPFVLRGASLGAGWRADRGGAAGTVYHAAGGSIPIASGIPIVAALLDLAPWAMPDEYQRGTAARFGQRIRARLVKDAVAVLVPAEATARDARRLLHVRQSRIRVVPLAARDAFRPSAADDAPAEALRLGLGAGYAVYAGRYDARQDLPTLLDAMARLAREGSPGEADPWPPRICLVGASPDDRAALSRAAGRAGVSEALAYAPNLSDDRLAALVAGARFLVQPVRSEATGLGAIEALAAGVPVVASAVGALPEIVGSAGILVEPGDAARLATALRAAWTNDQLHAQLVGAALERALGRRTWADVARETRAIWAQAASPA